jgi:hypothetical protein
LVAAGRKYSSNSGQIAGERMSDMKTLQGNQHTQRELWRFTGPTNRSQQELKKLGVVCKGEGMTADKAN